MSENQLESLAGRFDRLKGEIFGKGNYQGWERDHGHKMPSLRRLKGEFVKVFFEKALEDSVSPDALLKRVEARNLGFDAGALLQFEIGVVWKLETMMLATSSRAFTPNDDPSDVPDIGDIDNEDEALKAMYANYLLEARESGLH